MQARVRAAIWVVLYVALLLGVPAALPPDTTPSYSAHTLSVGESWVYQGASTFQGPAEAGLGTVVADVTNSSTSAAPGPTATVGFRATGGARQLWPFVDWQFLQSSEAWTSFTFNCSAGHSTVEILSPLPVAVPFPVKSSETNRSSSVTATFSGPCLSASSGLVSVSEAVSVLLPPGGSTSCTLYVCNEQRTYDVRSNLSLDNATGAGPLVAWSLQGVWDPSVATYRYLSVSSRPSGGAASGSLNLTLVTSDLPAVAPNPDVLFGYAESGLLVLVFPLLVLTVEFQGVRRRTEEEEASLEREVLAALPEEERGSAEEVDEEESGVGEPEDGGERGKP